MILVAISIRLFKEEDIPYKVKWINDEKNNKYLHYDLPLREDKTLQWFKSIQDKEDRADYTITYNNKPVGIIGLVDINFQEKDAEYYICVGEDEYKGKGVAKIATDLLIKEAYTKIGLKKIYLFTELANVRAQKFFEKYGFRKVKLLKNHLFYNDRYIDRYLYMLNIESHLKSGE